MRRRKSEAVEQNVFPFHFAAAVHHRRLELFRAVRRECGKAHAMQLMPSRQLVPPLPGELEKAQLEHFSRKELGLVTFPRSSVAEFGL